MPRVIPGPIEGDVSVREAVCVHTDKIYDSCKDKDCMEDVRVYMTASSQQAVDCASSIRARGAELLYADPDVTPVSFNRGYYTVDIRFYYKVMLEAVGASGSTPVCGLAITDKRVLLFGSEGSAKVFSSDTPLLALTPEKLETTGLPTAIVEAVDPIVLDAKISQRRHDHDRREDEELIELPEAIAAAFDDPIERGGREKQVLVTLGQFSIVRLERDSQMLMPAYDYCVPDKDCAGDYDDDPCALFSRIEFPVDEFFPPDTITAAEGYREVRNAVAE